MTDLTSKITDAIKMKWKLANTKLPVKKGTNENLLRISDHKLKPILEKDNSKGINYITHSTPLRKNNKNYSKASGDSNGLIYRVSSSNQNKKKNDRKTNLSYANDSFSNLTNEGENLNESLTKIDSNSRKDLTRQLLAKIN